MKKHNLTCMKCGKQFEKAEGNFYKNPNNSTGYQYKCIKCAIEAQIKAEKRNKRIKKESYKDDLSTNMDLERLLKRKRILETEIMEMERKQRELKEIKKLIKGIEGNEN